MNSYQSKLIRKETVATDTVAFFFEKPAGFSFRPGQFLMVFLSAVNDTDPRARFHQFSLASAPSESHLMIVTRMRDTAFKHHLGALVAGDTVEIRAPFGNFLADVSADRAHVFLAGGVGITPFRSFLQSQNDNGITLFYFNRERGAAPFLDELDDLSRKFPGFRFVPVMTRAGSDWKGETGYATPALLAKYISQTNNTLYYIAGPPQMVVETKKTLQDAGIADDRIHAEMFTGY